MFNSPILGNNNRLARRLALYVVLASTFITIFTSAFQLYEIYETHVSNIEIRLDEIRVSYSDNVASRVWVANQQELEQTLRGILRLQDIEYIEVYEDNSLIAQQGQLPDTDTIVREFPLHYIFHNKKQEIGKIKITASLKDTYQQLIDQALTIIASNAIKTFLISGFMLFLFYQLAARHLHSIAEYAGKITMHNLGRQLKLDRKESDPQHQDEFDLLVKSLNSMQSNLESSIKQLTKSEINLSQTLNSIGDAVITTDTKGNVTRMNPVAEALTGWSLEQAEGMSLKIIFPIVDATTRAPMDNPVDKVLTTGETVFLSNHTTLISKNGTEYQIADSAAPILDGKKILGLVLVFNDVTEQYHLRETANKNKRDLQAIMNHSPAVIYVKDIEGKFTFVNQQFEKIFSLNRADIIGQTLHDIFPAKIANQMAANDKAVLAARHAIESEEAAPHDDGMHTYNSIKFPLVNDDNIIYATCGISTDITDSRRQDLQLRRTQKMDALGKLTGGIAHDYNNLLGIIMGYAELLNENLSTDPALEKHAQHIQRAAERGTKLTTKLLSFSRHKSPDATHLDINKLLLDQQLILEKTLTARITLALDLDEDLWPVFLDGNDLEDAIINMSINAMHAIPDNGKLTFRTQNQTLTDKDSQTLRLQAGDYVLLSITDTGVGMNTEIQDKIFDPFFSTKGERGTGLGLSQVYGFIERSDGAIKLYSEPEHGSSFSFYFPRSKKNMATTQVPAAPKIPISKGSETLLVVDDEPALAELAEEILSRQGYRVLTATGGAQALSILENENVDLIISDIIMPNMDGYQLAAQVQQRYPHIKLQMVSGFTDDRNNQLTDSSLHKNLIHKPYRANVLLARVRSLLDESLPETNISTTEQTQTFPGIKILIVDDDDDTRALFTNSLQKLGCTATTTDNGDEACSLYQKSWDELKPIDAIILDLTIPGSQGGKEIATKIRTMNSSAIIIVSSGNSSSPEMTNPLEHGFSAALEKNYDLNTIKQTLAKVLPSN